MSLLTVHNTMCTNYTIKYTYYIMHITTVHILHYTSCTNYNIHTILITVYTVITLTIHMKQCIMHITVHSTHNTSYTTQYTVNSLHHTQYKWRSNGLCRLFKTQRSLERLVNRSHNLLPNKQDLFSPFLMDYFNYILAIKPVLEQCNRISSNFNCKFYRIFSDEESIESVYPIQGT